VSQKTKWFDAKDKRAVSSPLPLPSPILNTAQLAQPDIDEFIAVIKTRASGPCYALFISLATQPARVRLGRNLKVLIERMVERPIDSIMCDGLRADEQQALIEIEKLGLTMPMRVTAQALLNINERYQLALALGQAFQ